MLQKIHTEWWIRRSPVISENKVLVKWWEKPILSIRNEPVVGGYGDQIDHLLEKHRQEKNPQASLIQLTVNGYPLWRIL